MKDENKTKTADAGLPVEDGNDQAREATAAPQDIPDLALPDEDAKNVSTKTKDAVKRTLNKDDYANAGKDIKKGVNKGKEIAEQLNAQEKLNALVIKIKTEYGPKLNSIENKWKKVPGSLQSYIVHFGPLAALPAMIFPPGGIPATAACAATSFLVKTGLLSFKGEIRDGKIDLNKSVTIGDGMKKITKLIAKGLQYFFEELDGLEEVLDPVIEGAQYGDKMCAVAKANLYKHLKKEGKTKLEITPSMYGKKAA